jgi:hypothetical protein
MSMCINLIEMQWGVQFAGMMMEWRNNKLMNIENEGDSSIGKKADCLTLKLAGTPNPMRFPILCIYRWPLGP